MTVKSRNNSHRPGHDLCCRLSVRNKCRSVLSGYYTSPSHATRMDTWQGCTYRYALVWKMCQTVTFKCNGKDRKSRAKLTINEMWGHCTVGAGGHLCYRIQPIGEFELLISCPIVLIFSESSFECYAATNALWTSGNDISWLTIGVPHPLDCCQGWGGEVILDSPFSS